MTSPADAGPSPSEREILARYLAAGQEQVFRFLPRLTRPERDRLFAQAASIDLGLVARLSAEVLGAVAAPAALSPLEAVGPDHPDQAAALAAVRDLFRAGRVAFYTVAGGQGTRLGFDGPKGAFAVGPRSGKTLFEWHAEKAAAAATRYGRPVPWILLVSEANAAATREHFEAHAWYGLEGFVRLVTQRMLPAVNGEGRILLAGPGEILLSPNGHGGSIDALGRGGTIRWLRDRGVEYLSYFQVDNPLLNAADPAFLGHQARRGADMSAKVVRKSHPDEKAGVVARIGGRPGVVEYSEIRDADAAAVGPDGRLLYDLANIAAHGFRLDFLEALQGAGLPYHTAVKKVATVDDDGNPVEVIGRKFETFVFDAIPRAERFFAFLTERAEEFAPLKNADGENSPETVRAAILARTRGWYQRAGLPVPPKEDLEMSPLTAYDYDSFLARFAGHEDAR